MARLSITVSWLALAVLVAPAAARAEARWCEWTSGTLFSARGALVCYPDSDPGRPCAGDADCVSTAGAVGSDRLCIGGECMPPCSTIRLCEVDADDCGVGASCRPVSSGRRPDILTPDGAAFSPNGVCVLDDPSSTSTALPRALCPDGAASWDAWERAHVYEHDFGTLGTRPVHTNAWGFGDFDGDGCPNDLDALACVSPSGPCAVDPAPPASCGPRTGTGECCTIEAGTLVCDPDPGACDCSTTLRLCSPGPRVFSTECPPLGTSEGTCVRPDQPGAVGVCLYLAFLDDCSDLGALDAARCFVTPDGAPTANFFEGDCDDDGCPNGNDPFRCNACDGVLCSSESTDPRVDCRQGADPLPDPARCAPVEPDAAVAPDAGAAGPMDAGTEDAGPEEARPPVRFSGGGCTCRAGARPARVTLGEMLGVTALGATALGVGRRRRRSRRADPDDALPGLRR